MKLIGAALVLTMATAMAQTKLAARPEFEVASIKPDSPPDVFAGEFNVELAGGRLTVRQIILREFIEKAYGVRPFQLSGGPGWINSQGYDIEAKAEGSVTKQQMALLMQALLENRFRLKIHRETRNLAVYNLAAAKGGNKLHLSDGKGCVQLEANARLPQPEPGRPLLVPCGRPFQMTTPPGARMQGAKVVMPQLIDLLTTVLGRPVIDKTGFQGAFDFNLEFAVDNVLAGLHPSPADPLPASDPATAPSILAAIQRQLGLKLEPAAGPVEVIVIDRVERPTGN